MTDFDLISHYADGPGGIFKRLFSIESKMDDMLLPGYRRDGSETSSVFAGGGGSEVAGGLNELSGANQILVSDDGGSVGTLAVPPYGWIGRNAGGISAGAFQKHSTIVRTGETGGELDDFIYTATCPPGGSLYRTRKALADAEPPYPYDGPGGIYTQDLLGTFYPGDIIADRMDAQKAPKNATIFLNNNGPYVYYTEEQAGSDAGLVTFKLDNLSPMRPGVQWIFLAPRKGIEVGSGRKWKFRPSGGQRINDGTSGGDSGRFDFPHQHAMCVLTSTFSASQDRFTLVSYNNVT